MKVIIYDEYENMVYLVKGQCHRNIVSRYGILMTGTEWNYSITNGAGSTVAVISKEFFMTDTYAVDIVNLRDALHVLMFTLAIDVEKCLRQ